MVEVAKPDYLSLVNKGGSGFNVSGACYLNCRARLSPRGLYIHLSKIRMIMLLQGLILIQNR
ncbi:MAG: hypothetical protein CM15mP109_15450 [Candidatus Dadabacteria bacterium]|nr:MAG: hypothetical protein CM15mP109_15450 [Candidatus Dadabacteria bacterium]